MKKKMIEANKLQRDPEFIETLNNCQRLYRNFFEDRHKNTNLSESKILAEYIKTCDIVYGIFKDDQYELGWGIYIIKGQHAAMRIVREGKTEQVSCGAIPCRMLEEAVAMSKVYGDIKQSN